MDVNSSCLLNRIFIGFDFGLSLCVCVCVLPTCFYVYHMHAKCSSRPEEGTGFLGNGVIDSCEPSYEGWKMNSSPLQVQQMLLTVEPFLQLQ